ncbi:MAG: FIST N-terminal domain-containing protein [Geitlerinemataceae cyanobacterium]
MKWVNALSTRPSLEAAVEEVVDCVQQSLPGEANLGFVFISAAFASEYPRLMPLLQERLSVSNLIGCGGGGIVGGDLPGQSREIEGEPALSLTLAYLPGVKVETFHVSSEALPDLDSPPHRWVEAIGVPPQDSPQFILLADPFRSRVNDLLEGLDFAYAGSVKVGGLASAGYSNRGTSLFCNYHLYDEGTVGVALSGNVVLDAIVAQGCRPIGKPYRVTEGERNIILGLEESTETGDLLPSGDSQPPLKLLRELLQTLSPEDRELAQNSLFIGLVRDEFKLTLDRGDFLIRNLIGVDPRMGAIAIGDRVRPGQRIQFHLRDAQTSAEDLEVLLQKYQNSHDGTATAGALMFACLGRGEGLYGEPDFDSRLFQKHLKDVSLSGFFCNGEIGPVGGTTFLHGYTSVFGICRQP